LGCIFGMKNAKNCIKITIFCKFIGFLLHFTSIMV
jgi:hypothetical protein